MVSIELKRQIGIQLSDILSQHLARFTPVVIIHDGDKILDHGSGVFLLIENRPIVVTAAHVIKDYPDDMIHVLGTFTPSDYRQITAEQKEYWGGEIGDELDVGYLVLPEKCIDYFGKQAFLTLDKIDAYPEELSTDLTVFYGMPEVLHDRLPENQDRFQPFMYMAGIEDGTDWSNPKKRQIDLTMEYPLIVRDTLTMRDVTTLKPSGMSGGGLWRSYINKTSTTAVYAAELSKLIAIGTEWLEPSGKIKANRIEVVLHLLSLQFPMLNEILEAHPSAC